VGDLGNRQERGALDPTNPYVAGAWTVAFTPRVLGYSDDFEVYHIVVNGPSGSSFKIYIDTTFYDNVQVGDINSWDPSQPMYVTRGRTIFFYYNVTTTPAPSVTIFCRQPSPV
jgi:hypothetical protein